MGLPTRKRNRIMNTRDQDGLCDCRVSGCSGIRFAIADGNQTNLNSSKSIPPGTPCLYFHKQNGTMGAQTSWAILENFDINNHSKIRNDPASRQLCTACLQPAKRGFFKIAVGGIGYLSIHEECLNKILSIPYHRVIELSFLSSKRGKLAVALLEKDQRDYHSITQKDYEKACKDLQTRKDIANITEDLFEEWKTKATISMESPDSNHCSLSLTAHYYKKHTLKVDYWFYFDSDQKAQCASARISGTYTGGTRGYVMQSMVDKFLIDVDLMKLVIQKGKLAFNGLSYRQFEERFLEIYVETIFEQKLNLQTATLLLVDENPTLRSMATEYLKRVA